MAKYQNRDHYQKNLKSNDFLKCFTKKFKKRYIPIRKKYKIVFWEICSLLFFRSRISILNYSYKSWILRQFEQKLDKLVIKRDVHIKSPWELQIGDNVWIGRKWIDNISMITIGSNVCISQGVQMTSGNHNYKKEDFELISSPINISSNVWIGCFSVILPGSNIPPNLIISGGSVFPKNYDSRKIL